MFFSFRKFYQKNKKKKKEIWNKNLNKQRKQKKKRKKNNQNGQWTLNVWMWWNAYTKKTKLENKKFLKRICVWEQQIFLNCSAFHKTKKKFNTKEI